jgi:hypothetical protein
VAEVARAWALTATDDTAAARSSGESADAAKAAVSAVRRP